ncbi:Mis12 protein [Carex littledalei]|uniref:Mis12 protein n=1 Tax=Carex littledalei TaxID=544730 RepID=A0A833QGW6_9POAL|nr:Mis12 protein [Carex littledalei]
MEAERTSEGEAFFESLGLNPRLFLNDVLNNVDDLTDSAFEIFLQEAPKLISIVGDEKAQALDKGTKSIQKLINAAKAKGFGCWERLCLEQVFAVPEGMSLSENNDSSKNLAIEVELSDMELDSELESLRKELAAAQKEHEKLHSEITLLEKGSNFRTKFDTSVVETLGVYEDNSVQESFRDILKAIPELHQKLSDMRTKSHTSVHHPLFSGSYVDTVPASNEDFSGRLEDVRDVINILRAKKAY